MPSAYYVYAIVGRDTPLPARTTFRTAGGVVELAKVPCRELAAVAARRVYNAAPFTMQAILHHEAVVEAVRVQGPALPVRFGTVFRDEPSVTTALAERYESFAADLDRLGDKVELSLTALWPAHVPDAGPLPRHEARPTGESAGARYLHERVDECRRDDALKRRARLVARRIDQGLSRWALERRVSLHPRPGVAVRTTYLLDPLELDDFRAAFDSMRRQIKIRLLLTGPWPPYSFVSRTETEGEAPAVSGRRAQVN